MHNGIAAMFLALTILGVVFGTIVQADDPVAAGDIESVIETEWRTAMERSLAQVERGLRRMAGTPQH